MKIFRYLLLVFALLFSVIIIFEFVPNLNLFQFQFKWFEGIRIELSVGEYAKSVFSSRIISYLLIITFYIVTNRSFQKRNDRLLLVIAISGLISELYNLLNILIIQGRTNIFHWDILIVYFICAKIIQLKKEEE